MIGNSNYPAGVTEYDFVKPLPQWYEKYMEYEPELYRDGIYHVDDAITNVEMLIKELEELKEELESYQAEDEF